MKAKITYKGSDDDGGIDPAVWGEGETSFSFPRGKAVEIDSKDESQTDLKRQLAHRIITKAQHIATFEVELLEEDPPVDPRAGLPKDYTPVEDDDGDDSPKKTAAAHHHAPVKKK